MLDRFENHRNEIKKLLTDFAEQYELEIFFSDSMEEVDTLLVSIGKSFRDGIHKNYKIDIYSDGLERIKEICDDVLKTFVEDSESNDEKKNSYRDKLVGQIKLAGKDLIDRAESFVAKDLDTISGFRIVIEFPLNGPIDISTKMNTYCKAELKELERG